MLANKLLKMRLNSTGYYHASTTPDVWRHKWVPNLFVLIVNNFGKEYVDDFHVHNLKDALKSHYIITKDLEGTKFSGIDFEWDYIK